MRPARKIFGSKLKDARERRFLSQRELGDLVGLTEGRIGSIEQSEVTGIDVFRVPKFAAALRLTDEEFLKLVEAPADAATGTGAPSPKKAEADLFKEMRAMAAAKGKTVAEMFGALIQLVKLSDEKAIRRWFEDVPPQVIQSGDLRMIEHDDGEDVGVEILERAAPAKPPKKRRARRAGKR